MKLGLGIIIAGIAGIIALLVLTGKPKAEGKSYEENVETQLESDLNLEDKPSIMGAAPESVTIGGEKVDALIVDSTQIVEVVGTNLPEMQTLQAAAQITQTAVISSASIQALGGEAEITNTFVAETGTDLFAALATQLVVLKQTNTLYAGGIGGYTANGTPIFILTPQTSFFGLEQINGNWYKVSIFRFGERKRFEGIPIISKEGIVSFPPTLAETAA